jgi:ketosteroid isomerase-like protein
MGSKLFNVCLALAAGLLWLGRPALAAQPDAGMAPGPLARQVQAAYQSYVNGDVEGIVALTTADVTWGGIGPADFGAPFGMYEGHAGVRRWFKELAAASGPYQLTDLEFHEDGSSVTVAGWQSTTFAGGSMESGPFVHFFKFRDGKISSFWNCVDSAAVLQAAGHGVNGPAGAMGMAGGMSKAGGMNMPEPKGTATEQANIATIATAYSAFAVGDIESILGTMSDDITWDAVGPPGTLPIFGKRQGKAAVLDWFSSLAAETQCEPFSNLRYIARGDTVVALGDSKVTFLATGKVVNSPFVHVFTFRDGKIVAWQGFEDTAADVMAAS